MTTARRDAILDDLNTLFQQRLGTGDLDPLDESTRFFADLGLASIDAVVLGEALRVRYGSDLPFGDLMADLGRRDDRDLTIGELVDFLHRHVP